MGRRSPYFCIHCGHAAPQVYKTYANGNLVKLLACRGCGELVDKYVEYDPIIIAINLVLQNPMAYRHVLLNSAFEGFWKLGIVFLFCEAYCHWCFQKGVEVESEHVDFYELEINFYRVLLRTLFSSSLFHSCVLLSCFFAKKMSGKGLGGQFSYFTVWKGLCLSGFSEIFQLIALIWSYSPDQFRFLFVTGLFIFTNVQGYYVTTGIAQWKSFLVIMGSYFVRKYCLEVYDTLVDS